MTCADICCMATWRTQHAQCCYMQHQPSFCNCLHIPQVANPALVAAAAAAAADCSRPPSSSSARPPSSSGRAGSSSSAASSSNSNVSAGPKTFDVGSRGGFYTEKSPKLMLHEWCTQQKRPKPKYKAVAVDADKGGGFRCY